MKTKGTIIITDPCYVVKDEDWSKCAYGDHLEVLGFSNFISKTTLYGDWSCTTFNMTKDDIKEVIDNPDHINDKNFLSLGKFCADAGMVCVLNFDDVVKYNPEFPKWVLEHSWCVTVIPHFDGEIKYCVDKNNDAHIIGIGNINFYTTQTCM